MTPPTNNLDKLTILRLRPRGDLGQDLVEYGLLAGLIAVVAVSAVSVLGQQINQVFWQTIAASF